jgi:hypothetical protein
MGSSRSWKKTEIEVCRRLAAWWDPAKFPLKSAKKAKARDLPFRRTPNSGGWGGHADMKADIQGPPGWPFSIEIKAQKSWSFDEIIRGKSKQLATWWSQSCKAAKKSDRTPLLVFTKPRMGYYVRMSPAQHRKIQESCGTKIRVFLRRPDAVYCMLAEFLYDLKSAAVRDHATKIASIGV